MAPRASSQKWLAVAIVTAMTTGGYSQPNTRSQRWSPSSANVPPASSAKATCPEGIAA